MKHSLSDEDLNRSYITFLNKHSLPNSGPTAKLLESLLDRAPLTEEEAVRWSYLKWNYIVNNDYSDDGVYVKYQYHLVPSPDRDCGDCCLIIDKTSLTSEKRMFNSRMLPHIF